MGETGPNSEDSKEVAVQPLAGHAGKIGDRGVCGLFKMLLVKCF